MTISLVTGSSTGIGLATALCLTRGGHKVFGTMRHPQGAPELAETAARERLDVTVLAIGALSNPQWLDFMKDTFGMAVEL